MAPAVAVRGDGLYQTASAVSANSSQTAIILGVLVPFLLVVLAVPVIMFKRHLDTRSISHTLSGDSERCVISLDESFDVREALGKQLIVEEEIKVPAVDEALSEDSVVDETNATAGGLTTVIPSVSLSSLTSMICYVSTSENFNMPLNIPFANSVRRELSSPESLDVTDQDRLTNQLAVARQSPVAITISISPSSTKELVYLLGSPASSARSERLSHLDPFQDMNVEGLVQAFATSFTSSVYYARDSVLSHSFAIGTFDYLIDCDLNKALLSSTPTSLEVSESVDPTGSSLTVNSCTSTQRAVVHSASKTTSLSVSTYRSKLSSRPSLQTLRTRPISNSRRETLGELWDEDDEKLFGVAPRDRLLRNSKPSNPQFAGVNPGQLWDVEDDEIFSVSSHSPVTGSPIFMPLPLLDFQTENLHTQSNSGNSETAFIRTWTEDAFSFFGGMNNEFGSHNRPTILRSQGSPMSDSSRSSSSSSEASLISLPVQYFDYFISQKDDDIHLQPYQKNSSVRSSLMSLASVLSGRAEWSFNSYTTADSDSSHDEGVHGDLSVLGFVCLTCRSFVDKESVAKSSSPDENILQTSGFSSLISPRVSAKEWKQEQLSTPLISGVSDELSAINLRQSGISSPSFSSPYRSFPFDIGRGRIGSAQIERHSESSLYGLPVY